MKLLSIILLVLSVSANAQSKCIQPSVVGNFTPILTLQSGSTTTNYTFGILATAHNGEGIASYSYSILTGSGTLVNANSQSAYITNLTQGTTSVRLIVADSCGSKDSSYVLITVNPAPPHTVNGNDKRRQRFLLVERRRKVFKPCKLYNDSDGIAEREGIFVFGKHYSP